MRYCTKCVMPDTRPGLTFNDKGVCSACEGAMEKKEKIDWKARKKELKEIFDRFRSPDGTYYDCIVPVSGGKDSIYQVHMVKNVFKMNPLCITFRTDARTKIGEHNIQALREIGVDHIDFTPDPKGIRKLRLKTFREVGDCSIADHLNWWNIMPYFALKLRIPLVIWGENPDMEYGGTKDLRHVAKLNRGWMRNQDILKGKTIKDWCDENLTIDEVKSFDFYPDEDELDKIGYTPVFLGYYLPWDIKENLEVARSHGFMVRDKGPIMGIYNYADLDCMYIVIHHYLKWYKFGFNRVTDNCCNEIRKGRMTREEAIKLVRERDGIKPPKKFIRHFCDRLGISEKEFWDTCEKFRNRKIWKQDDDNRWYIDGWIGGDKVPDEFPFEPED